MLDQVIATSCSVGFDLPTLPANAKFELRIELDGSVFEDTITPIVL